MYVHVSLESTKSCFWVLFYLAINNSTSKSSSEVKNETAEIGALIISDFTHNTTLVILMYWRQEPP
jgi:hypothetical protein